MPRDAKIIEIFLSSPSDVELERKFIALAARDWNSLRSRDTGFYLSILSWEDVASSKLGNRPQEAINTDIGDEYDVYLGLMWGKFGVSTGVAPSGTVEEFDRALDRYRQGERVRIAMLFKTSAIPQRELVGSEFDKVQEFKTRFSSEGGLYKNFEDEDGLRRVLAVLFEDIARSNGALAGGEVALQRLEGDNTTAKIVADPNEDIGFIEIQELIVVITASQSLFFDGLSKVTQQQNDVITSVTAETNKLVILGQASTDNIKPLTDRVSESLLNTASYLEENLLSFISGNDALVDATEKGLDLAGDFSGPGKTELRDAVFGVIEMLAQNEVAILDGSNSLRQMPRLTSYLNKSRNRLVKSQENLISEIIRLRDKLKSVVEKHP